MKGEPERLEKSSEKKFDEIFEQCHSAEKCKRGTLWDFLTSIVLQNIGKTKGRPFGAIQKISKKSRIGPKKNPSEKHQMGGSLVCFRGSERRCFCFGRGRAHFLLECALKKD